MCWRVHSAGLLGVMLDREPIDVSGFGASMPGRFWF
jgi:hypothetical protein